MKLIRSLVSTGVVLLGLSWPHADLYAQEADLSTEPEITIKREEEKVIYEYRINGILKEIKIVPRIGPSYYLVPSDGEGWIREEKSQLLVPSWVIFSW